MRRALAGFIEVFLKTTTWMTLTHQATRILMVEQSDLKQFLKSELAKQQQAIQVQPPPTPTHPQLLDSNVSLKMLITSSRPFQPMVALVISTGIVLPSERRTRTSLV